MSTFKQVFVLDVQNEADVPQDVVEEVQGIWRSQGLGNDYYYVRIDAEEDDHYPALVAYMRANGIENCLVHWWW